MFEGITLKNVKYYVEYQYDFLIFKDFIFFNKMTLRMSQKVLNVVLRDILER